MHAVVFAIHAKFKFNNFQIFLFLVQCPEQFEYFNEYLNKNYKYTIGLFYFYSFMGRDKIFFNMSYFFLDFVYVLCLM